MIRCTNNNPISYDSRYLFPKESVRIYQCLISIRWYKDPGIGILVQHLDRSLLFPLTSSINKFLLSERSIYLSLSNKISRLFKNPKESHNHFREIRWKWFLSSFNYIVWGSIEFKNFVGAREKDRAQRKRREISSMRITIVGERS